MHDVVMRPIRNTKRSVKSVNYRRLRSEPAGERAAAVSAL